MHGMVHVFQTCLNNVNNYITYRNNDNVFVLCTFMTMIASRCNCRWEWRVLMGNHRCWCQSIKQVCKFCLTFSHWLEDCVAVEALPLIRRMLH